MMYEDQVIADTSAACSCWCLMVVPTRVRLPQAAREGIPPAEPSSSAKEAAEAEEAKVEQAGRTTAAALHPSPSARTAQDLAGGAADTRKEEQQEEEEGFPPPRPMPQAAAKDEKVCMQLPESAKSRARYHTTLSLDCGHMRNRLTHAPGMLDRRPMGSQVGWLLRGQTSREHLPCCRAVSTCQSLRTRRRFTRWVCMRGAHGAVPALHQNPCMYARFLWGGFTRHTNHAFLTCTGP
jgi:hypothetical protein